MLTELVYLQMFYSVMYIIFQILGLWSDEYQATADPRIAYTALTPKSSFYLQWLFYIIHGSTTFLYPLFLVARKKYVMRRFSDKTFKSRADVETLWTKPDGKALIADITRKAFALGTDFILYHDMTLTYYVHRKLAFPLRYGCTKYIYQALHSSLGQIPISRLCLPAESSKWYLSGISQGFDCSGSSILTNSDEEDSQSDLYFHSRQLPVRDCS